MTEATTQRQEALKRANEFRSARRELKGEIRAGVESVPQILRRPEVPALLRTMHVETFLCLPKHAEHRKARRFMRQAGVNPAACLGTVTYRQRRVLAQALEEQS